METRFLAALKDKKIKNASIEELDMFFRRCFVKVGMRGVNLPTDEEAAILYGHFKKNFGEHTIQEADLAFDMAIMEQLDVDANPYENFSCAYLSRIINGYRRWSAEEFKIATKNSIPKQYPTINIDWGGLIEKEYQMFLQGRSNYRTFPSEFYDKVVQDGFMYAYAYQDSLKDAKTLICGEIQKDILAYQSKEEDYNKVQDLQKKLIEYRNGSRDAELILLAKQTCMWVLFNEAKKTGFSNLYIQSDD